MNLRRIFLALAGAALVGQRTARAGEAPWERAGALLADGKATEAADAAQDCAGSEPRCALIFARALSGSGRFGEASGALAAFDGRFGALEAHAALLAGEIMVLNGRPREALDRLRFAAHEEPQGPVALRAAALEAEAMVAAEEFAAAATQALKAEALPGQPPEIRASLASLHAEALTAQLPAAPGLRHDAALALRSFWLLHPEHPGSAAARAQELALGAGLPEPVGHDLLLRATRLLSAGKPGAAVSQAQAAVAALAGGDAAEAQLLYARALAADGRRIEAAPALEIAWKTGSPHVAAQAGMLFARDRSRRGQDADGIRIADELQHRFPGAPESEEAALFCARLELDAGKKPAARVRLARLAALRHGPNASAARWNLAWLSYADGLRDAIERFAEFAATAESDEERAQGVYWQARAGKPQVAAGLYRRAAGLDPLGWYGLLARQRLGESARGPAPFPPVRLAPASVLPARLALADELARLGFLGEAAAEADFFVQQGRGAPDAVLPALRVYEHARRFDRSVTLGDSLLGARSQLTDLNALSERHRLALEAAYPTAFPREVAASAARVHLDPYLLLSVMRRESLFKADARSVAGAVGLLQLLPATARRAAVVLGRPPLRDEDLLVPGTAIDLGAWYLAELFGRFGDAAPAAAAYNAGPRIAAPWAVRGAGEPLDRWVEEIPYRETRKYIKIVVGVWSAYRILAGGSPPALSATVPAVRPGAAF